MCIQHLALHIRSCPIVCFRPSVAAFKLTYFSKQNTDRTVTETFPPQNQKKIHVQRVTPISVSKFGTASANTKQYSRSGSGTCGAQSLGCCAWGCPGWREDDRWRLSEFF